MTDGTNWQEVLWTIPTSLGWVWYAIWGVMAGTAALIMFFTMILNHAFNALLVARSLLGIGLMLIPLCVFQSGWQAWIPAFYATGGLMSAILIATNWCNREDRSRNVGRALWAWAIGGIGAAVCWVCGPRSSSRREDLL